MARWRRQVKGLSVSSVDPAPDGTPKIERLIAIEEGFYKHGSLPNRNHNPGDLRHSPHSFHSFDAPDAIGQIDSDADGWADMALEMRFYASLEPGDQRNRPFPGLTVAQAVFEYAPPTENNSAAYLSFIINGAPHEGISGLGCSSDTLLSEALKIIGDPYDNLVA
jgi:hypothetical protein